MMRSARLRRGVTITNESRPHTALGFVPPNEYAQLAARNGGPQIQEPEKLSAALDQKRGGPQFGQLSLRSWTTNRGQVTYELTDIGVQPASSSPRSPLADGSPRLYHRAKGGIFGEKKF